LDHGQRLVGQGPRLVVAPDRYAHPQGVVGVHRLDRGEGAFVLQVGDQAARPDGGGGDLGLRLDLVDLGGEVDDLETGQREQRDQRHGQGRGQLGANRYAAHDSVSPS